MDLISSPPDPDDDQQRAIPRGSSAPAVDETVRLQPLSDGTDGTLGDRPSRVRRVASLLKVLVPRELRLRYRASALNAAWAFITPVVNLAVYGLVLTQSFGVEAECSPYLVSAWTGMVVWMFVASAIGSGVSTYLASSALITKVYFPREALPLASTASALPDLGIGFATVIALMVATGVPMLAAGPLVVLPIALLVVWTAAVSTFLSAVAVFARDVVHGVNVALRAGFFATPVVYETSFLPSSLAWTAEVNPVAVGITGVRETLLCGRVPDLPLLVVHLAVACLFLVGAIAYTRAVESRLVDLV